MIQSNVPGQPHGGQPAAWEQHPGGSAAGAQRKPGRPADGADEGLDESKQFNNNESATPTTVEVQVPREGLHAGTSYEAILPAVR